MLAKRIIPCLDVDKGHVVKGTQFKNLREVGDPVDLAKIYNNEGADELVFLDITASSDNRKTVIDMIKKVAKEVFIPFTVGGGVRSVEDIRTILLAGADKVAVNTAAITNPELIKKAADIFGNQCIVLAVDAKKKNDRWEVYINGGRVTTGIDVLRWIQQAVQLGAGEILLTSIDKDGSKNGYDTELTKLVSENVQVPVIASGGAGKKEDFLEVLTQGKADAALAAGLFHSGELKIKELKNYLKQNHVETRL